MFAENDTPDEGTTTPEQTPEENPRRLEAVSDQPAAGGEDGGRAFEDLEDDDTELFPAGSLEGDPNLSIAKLLKGKPQTLEVKMKGGSTGLKGGIIDPHQVGRAMVVHEVEKIELVPQREGEPGNRKIVGWTIRQILRPTYTEDLDKAVADPATGLGQNAA